MSNKHVPIVDIGQPYGAFVKAFGDAFVEYGFATVVGHGLKWSLVERAYHAADKAFGLPLDTKRKYEEIDGHRVGYAPFGSETAVGYKKPDRKEFWHIRARGAYYKENQFPKEVRGFREASLNVFKGFDAISIRLLDALNRYLKMPEGQLSGWVKDGDSLLRYLHYFEMKDDELKSAKQDARGGAHTDINLITLLPSATEAGLEVLPLGAKQWLPVENPPGALIINAGDMLHVASHLRMPSTLHRVVNANGRKRLSMPFFVHPRNDVVLCKAGEFLKTRLSDIGN